MSLSRRILSLFATVALLNSGIGLQAANPAMSAADVDEDDVIVEMTLDDAISQAYEEFLRLVAADELLSYDSLTITGSSRYTAGQLTDFVRRHNPDFDPEIALNFIEVGGLYGIRGDVALCQAIVETGWFGYRGGTAVTAEMHNYCGLGVTARGVSGAGFPTVKDGVTAHIQHLYAYCSKSPLPDGETQVDPRFGMVIRGCATRWHDLNYRWAMNGRYGAAILSVYASLADYVSKCQKQN